MIYEVTEKPALGTEGDGGSAATQWEKVDAFHKQVASLMYNAM